MQVILAKNMTNIIEFPIWLPKNEPKYIKTNNTLKEFLKLVEYYEKKANQLLAEKNIRVQYSINYHDPKNDHLLEKWYDKAFSYAESKPNIFAFHVPRIYKNPEKTFSAHKLNKIKFVESDPMWNIKKIPDKTYDYCVDTNYTNRELVSWYSDTKKFKKIKFLHIEISNPSMYKDFLSRENKKIFSSQEFKTTEKNWKKVLRSALKSLPNDTFIITNIYLNELNPSSNKFAEEFYSILDVNNKFVDVLTLGMHDKYIGTVNQSNKINVFSSISKEPWQYYAEQAVYKRLDIDNKNIDNEYMHELICCLSCYNLIVYVIYKNNLVPFDRDFVSKLDKEIGNIDNFNDIFIDDFNTYIFKKRKNIYGTNGLVTVPSHLYNYENKDKRTKALFDKQVKKINNKLTRFKTFYCNFDIVRITNIDIGAGTWACEFYLDVISDQVDPIKCITFHNLSISKSKYEVKSEGKIKSKLNEISHRYYIVANFDFEPKADNYPFDWQHIYINYSVQNEIKNGIIQPIPKNFLDTNFSIEGWKFRNTISGSKRSKEEIYIDKNFRKKVNLKKVAHVGWTLSRANYITVSKICIPLIFLFFLNYYSLFIEYEKSLRQISILTTTFLSGIALYFSAERPQPNRMTTIDLIFIWYYVQSGLIIVISAITSGINENVFYNFMNILKFIIPFGICFLVLFVIFRTRNKKLKPELY